jgi:putative component of toxin-antitoxin plasmid stabilization module
MTDMGFLAVDAHFAAGASTRKLSYDMQQTSQRDKRPKIDLKDQPKRVEQGNEGDAKACEEN